MTGGPVGKDLGDAIHKVIGRFPNRLIEGSRLGDSSVPLAIKYIPTRYGALYAKSGNRLKISDTPGFTWGRGTYVTPLVFPLSGAIFGRVGVVAGFDPSGWRTFDATVPANQRLYLRWLQLQPLYRRFALTAHSTYLSQILRDLFRRSYRIDCVLFPPDQTNPAYTRAATDVWMVVTDWTPAGDIASGFSDRFAEPRLTVVVEEEFEDRMGGIHREGLLKLGTSTRPAPSLAAILATTYRKNRPPVRIAS